MSNDTKIKDFMSVLFIFFISSVMVLLGLYIHSHGDFTPGGGFQSGIIIAIAFVMLTVLTDKIYFRESYICILSFIGVLIYVLVCTLPIFFGYNFAEYNYLHETKGQEIGIILVELGVGITVFASLTLILMSLYKRCKA